MDSVVIFSLSLRLFTQTRIKSSNSSKSIVVKGRSCIGGLANI